MNVFRHHLYEFEKGLRNLILHTTEAKKKKFIEKRLKDNNIPYIIYNVTSEKINVFFGNESCINVVKQIGKSDLKDYTDEEDFMLGIMLGYDRVKQCQRYMKRQSARE
ncbi:MAG: DUF2023 family protein, partial [Bacillota bacterium]